MTSVLDLVRPDLRAFAGYASARREKTSGHIWLNANESPWPSSADKGQGLNRYPEPQPAALRARMADLYQVPPERLLVTRGSDEGIDLLVRAFCRAGLDGVLIAPPCFGMYAVSARVQNAPLVELPLDDHGGRFSLDLTAVEDVLAHGDVRVVFLCSPSNPTGQALSLKEIRRLVKAASGKAVVVVDEAYVEFSSIGSARPLLDEFPHLVLLRTLSKAHALAGARIGAVLADPDVIGVLRSLSAPYPVPAPSASLALEALTEAAQREAKGRIATAVKERDALVKALRSIDGVVHVYPSEGNFLLVRFADANAAFSRLLAAGVVVRDVRTLPQLGDALRISVGTPEENQAIITALAERDLPEGRTS
ncbi:MAG: histidinol-phosphate transaminase [Vicinamibacteria bacterium]|nr:histidinol-phosphate transaminase [Vicinamibacteria bacterium]